MDDHTAFVSDLEHTLQQENNLLNTILEKRLQINKNIEHE